MSNVSRSSAPKPRYFLALPLASSMRQELSTVSDALRGWVPLAKTSAPGRLHITLRYFGFLAANDRVLLEERIDRWTHSCPRIYIWADGLGVFDDRVPRVLYARVEGQFSTLRTWLGQVDADLACHLGSRLLPRSTSWIPHITLARARRRQGEPKFRTALTQIPCRTQSYPVNELVLLASEQMRVRSEYHQIRRFALEAPLMRDTRLDNPIDGRHVSDPFLE